MANLWKYITELGQTDVAYEDSDLVVINQGGHSVQIPWTILKAGVERKITALDEVLNTTAYLGSDLEKAEDADTSIDELMARLAHMNDLVTNLTVSLENVSATLKLLLESNSSLKSELDTLKLQHTALVKDFNDLPKIYHGDENPNNVADIVTQLGLKDGDAYIYTGDSE